MSSASFSFKSVLLSLLSASLLAMAAPLAKAEDLLALKPVAQPDFVLPAKPSQMLRAPLLKWQPVRSQVAALDGRVDVIAQRSKPAAP